MNKQEFVVALCDRLGGLPEQEVEDRVGFYCEMIDDRIEDGLSEEDAVLAIGSVDEIAEQILADVPLAKIVKEKMKKRRKLCAWEIVLLAVGSPIWLSLLIAAFAVVISVYAVLWSVIASVWAVEAALMGCVLGGVAGGVVLVCVGHLWVGLCLLAVALVCAGLSIFGFVGCLKATKGMAVLTKKIALFMKRCFVRKKEVA